MNINEVIKFPILTEKTYSQMEEGVYTFAVDRRTNKAEVKKVIEFIFDVKVEKINIFNVPKKPKKLGRFKGFTNSYKRAIAKLKDGQINIFPEDSQGQTNVEEANVVKEKAKQDSNKMTEAEKRAAEKIAKKTQEKMSKEKKLEEVIPKEKKVLNQNDSQKEKALSNEGKSEKPITKDIEGEK